MEHEVIFGLIARVVGLFQALVAGRGWAVSRHVGGGRWRSTSEVMDCWGMDVSKVKLGRDFGYN